MRRQFTSRRRQGGWVQYVSQAVGLVAANQQAKKAKASQIAAQAFQEAEARKAETAAKELAATNLRAAELQAGARQSSLSFAGLGGEAMPWVIAGGALLVVLSKLLKR